jgi:hypothetical protein
MSDDVKSDASSLTLEVGPGLSPILKVGLLTT